MDSSQFIYKVWLQGAQGTLLMYVVFLRYKFTFLVIHAALIALMSSCDFQFLPGMSDDDGNFCDLFPGSDTCSKEARSVSISISVPTGYSPAASLPSGLSFVSNTVGGSVNYGTAVDITFKKDCKLDISSINGSVAANLTDTLTTGADKNETVTFTSSEGGVDLTAGTSFNGIASNPISVSCGTVLNITASHAKYPDITHSHTVTKTEAIDLNGWIKFNPDYPIKNRDVYIYDELSVADKTITFSHNGDSVTCSTDGAIYLACTTGTTHEWSSATKTNYIKITKTNSSDLIYTFHPKDDAAKSGWITLTCDVSVSDGDNLMTVKEIKEYLGGAGTNMFDHSLGINDRVICIDNGIVINSTQVADGDLIRAYGNATGRLYVVAREGATVEFKNSVADAGSNANLYTFRIFTQNVSLVGLKITCTQNAIAPGAHCLNSNADGFHLKYSDITTSGDTTNIISYWNQGNNGIVIKDVTMTNNGPTLSHGFIGGGKVMDIDNLTITINGAGRALTIQSQGNNGTIKNSSFNSSTLQAFFSYGPGNLNFLNTSFYSSSGQSFYVQNKAATDVDGLVTCDQCTFQSDGSNSVVVRTDDVVGTPTMRASITNSVFKVINAAFSAVFVQDGILNLDGNKFINYIGSVNAINLGCIAADCVAATQEINSTLQNNTACGNILANKWTRILKEYTPNEGNFDPNGQINHSSNTDILDCASYGITP